MSEKKPHNPVKEPKEVDSNRFLRGGPWGSYPNILESAFRSHDFSPSSRYSNYGFRIARTKK